MAGKSAGTKFVVPSAVINTCMIKPPLNEPSATSVKFEAMLLPKIVTASLPIAEQSSFSPYLMIKGRAWLHILQVAVQCLDYRL